MAPSLFSRRAAFGLFGVAALALTGCNSVAGSAQRAATIDARVDAAIEFLKADVPGATELLDKSVGVLVMPLQTEASLGFGGSYGRGALRVNGATVDYYQSVEGSFGVQIGAQQYAHAIFFMTEPALQNFRNGLGLTAGGDLKLTMADNAQEISAQTLTAVDPVIGIVFGQAGLIGGASIEGTVYNRIIP